MVSKMELSLSSMFTEIEFTDLGKSALEILERTVSAVALEFCGFTPATAHEVCSRFIRRSDQDNNPAMYSQMLSRLPYNGRILSSRILFKFERS